MAVIQARMGSTRLPGKVLENIAGDSMLARCVERTQRAALLDGVIVATTTVEADDPVAALCAGRGWPCFRGSEDDVLLRYVDAACSQHANVVVRITADCPLIDPMVIDQVIEAFRDRLPDYASNTLQRSFPRGLDAEVIAIGALERAASEARRPFERAHVTPYIWQHPDLFQLISVATSPNLSEHRWTVDTPEDLEFVRLVCSRLGDPLQAGWRDVLALLDAEPELAHINRAVPQKRLEEG